MFLKKLYDPLAQALAEENYEKAYTLQKKCMSPIKAGQDLLCIGNEKSGQTTAIIVGIIHKLKEAIDDVPRALIVVPDNPRASKMLEQFEILAKHTNLRIHGVFEGGDLLRQKDKVYLGSDVVIGSAKKLNELYSNNGLNLNGLQTFVVDDAQDIMRNTGTAMVHRLADTIGEKQQLFFTKKMTEAVERYAEKYLNIMMIHDFTQEEE